MFYLKKKKKKITITITEDIQDIIYVQHVHMWSRFRRVGKIRIKFIICTDSVHVIMKDGRSGVLVEIIIIQ